MKNTEKRLKQTIEKIGNSLYGGVSFVPRRSNREALEKILMEFNEQTVAEEKERMRATLPKFTIGKCFSCE